MINPKEAIYWDTIASLQRDNTSKRQVITKRLLSLDLIGKSIIEIGCGLGSAFGGISIPLGRRFKYLGTDVSPLFVEMAKKYWILNTIQADVTEIPVEDASFDICVALDTLEHVHPTEREAGYKEISRILKPKAQVVLNIPLEESLHMLEFEHGFTLNDMLQLITVCDMELVLWEKYQVYIHKSKGYYNYIWAIAERGA